MPVYHMISFAYYGKTHQQVPHEQQIQQVKLIYPTSLKRIMDLKKVPCDELKRLFNYFTYFFIANVICGLLELSIFLSWYLFVITSFTCHFEFLDCA